MAKRAHWPSVARAPAGGAESSGASSENKRRQSAGVAARTALNLCSPVRVCEQTAFLPEAWRSVKGPDGQPYQYLWLLSRGPMSHGCTHLNAGHISELRQLLPSETEQLSEVDVFYNTSTLYDVFDIDGDFQPEVMGVRYFIAYSLKDNRPDRLRVRDERHAYYDWLYAGELTYDGTDGGVFPKVNDCRFVGRTAIEGAEYDHIPLHEADYEPEKIQFYRMVDIPFAKELRKVGVHHPFPALHTAPPATRQPPP